MNIKGAAEIHRSMVLGMLKASDESLEIAVPGIRQTATGATLFADLSTTEPDPVIKGPFKCLWYESTSLQNDRAVTAILGRYPTVTTIAKLALADVLKDPDDVYGDTWADTAKYVVYRGKKYEVIGVERHGFSTLPPYTVMLFLKGDTKRRV